MKEKTKCLGLSKNGLQVRPRLIAAAPDLLHALKVARATLVNALRANIEIAEFDPAEHVTVKTIDAAILKAEGNTNSK